MTKRKKLNIFVVFLMFLSVIGILTACSKVNFKVDFVVDGEI